MTDNIHFFQKIKLEELYKKLPRFIKNYFTEELDFYMQYAKGRVLDVGIGTGRISEGLISSEKISDIYGIDISDECVDSCKRLHPLVKVSKQDITKTDFDDNIFDTVILGYSVLGSMHQKVSSMIKEIKRILKPEGVVLFSNYSEDAAGKQEEVYKTIGFKKTYSDEKFTHSDSGNGTYSCRRFCKNELEEIFAEFNTELIKKEFTYFGKAIKKGGWKK